MPAAISLHRVRGTLEAPDTVQRHRECRTLAEIGHKKPRHRVVVNCSGKTMQVISLTTCLKGEA